MSRGEVWWVERPGVERRPHRVLPKSYFVGRICTLGPEQMDRVCRALAIATGCA